MAVNLLPRIDETETALKAFKSKLSAAESHGLLCGLICNTLEKESIDKKFWEMSELSAKGVDILQLEDYKRIFSQMLKISRRQLKSMNFDFQLMLTEQGKKLVDRVNELSAWCRGFINGFSKAMLEQEKQRTHSPEFSEAIEKLIETSRLSYSEVEEATEEDESHFADVVEFIRIAVLLVASELIVDENEIEGDNTSYSIE